MYSFSFMHYAFYTKQHTKYVNSKCKCNIIQFAPVDKQCNFADKCHDIVRKVKAILNIHHLYTGLMFRKIASFPHANANA